MEKLVYIPCAVNNDFFQQNIKKLSPRVQHIKDQPIGVREEDLVISMCCSFTKKKDQ